jgi:hypothetical protein
MMIPVAICLHAGKWYPNVIKRDAVRMIIVNIQKSRFFCSMKNRFHWQAATCFTFLQLESSCQLKLPVNDTFRKSCRLVDN